MPLRAFPVPFRVGTDICHIPRIHRLITRGKRNNESGDDALRPLQRFLTRLLTAPERAYFVKRFEPCAESFASKSEGIASFLAGRFAAKEACRKACMQFDKDTRGFQRIMILPVESPSLSLPLGGTSSSVHKSSRPQGVILDRVYGEAHDRNEPSGGMQEEEKELDGQLCEISISHDGEYATAVALVPDMSGVSRPRGA